MHQTIKSGYVMRSHLKNALKSKFKIKKVSVNVSLNLKGSPQERIFKLNLQFLPGVWYDITGILLLTSVFP